MVHWSRLITRSGVGGLVIAYRLLRDDQRMIVAYCKGIQTAPHTLVSPSGWLNHPAESETLAEGQPAEVAELGKLWEDFKETYVSIYGQSAFDALEFKD